MIDAYKVPDLAPGAFHRAEETVRRSRFIVTMARVSSPEEAKAFIDRIREEHAGATHNCWAYNAGAPGSGGRERRRRAKGHGGTSHAHRTPAQ